MYATFAITMSNAVRSALQGSTKPWFLSLVSLTVIMYSSIDCVCMWKRYKLTWVHRIPWILCRGPISREPKTPNFATPCLIPDTNLHDRLSFPFLPALYHIIEQVSSPSHREPQESRLFMRKSSHKPAKFLSSRPQLHPRKSSRQPSLGCQQHQPTYNITLFHQPNFIHHTTSCIVSLH
jgi:hypothetical protein